MSLAEVKLASVLGRGGFPGKKVCRSTSGKLVHSCPPEQAYARPERALALIVSNHVNSLYRFCYFQELNGIGGIRKICKNV